MIIKRCVLQNRYTTRAATSVRSCVNVRATAVGFADRCPVATTNPAVCRRSLMVGIVCASQMTRLHGSISHLKSSPGLLIKTNGNLI